MKTAAKIFIWIGMILQCFLIVPIIIGIIALRKIDDAYSASELKGIGVATLFLCSLLGGIFMLCMSDSSLTGGYSYHSGASAGTVIVRILGVLLALCGLFGTIGLLVHWADIDIVSVPTGTLSPVYDYSSFIGFGIGVLILLIITCIIICALMFFRAESAPKLITCVILSVLVLGALGIITFTRLSALPSEAEVAVQKERDRQVREERQEALLRAEEEWIKKINTLKFTEIKISELYEKAWRSPTIYDNSEITLEGYASDETAKAFILNFPGNGEIDNKCVSVKYTYSDEQPRVLEGDYVVVTGILSVSVYDEKNYSGAITGTYIEITLTATKCEIKEDPNVE